MTKVFFQEKFDLVEVEVSEQINKNHIQDFIATSLKLKDIEFINKKIFINYIDELCIYQIYLLKKEYKFFIFQIFEQFFLNNSNTNSSCLYLCNNFFCVYKDSKFYYYKKINNEINKNQLIDFIKSKFKITSIENIENDQVDKLKKSFLDKNIKQKLVFLNINKTYQFALYIFFLFILIFSLVVLLKNQNSKEQEDNYVNLNINSSDETNDFKSFKEELNLILATINKDELSIKSLEYNNKNIKIILSSNNKEVLYNFLKNNDTKISYSSINFLENIDLYEGIFDVGIFK